MDWWTGDRFIEVLDHSKAAVDLTYAQDGLPFLLDHDTRVMVGVIEDVRVGDDKKLRGFIRMGNHPDAGWVEQDIRGGIRKKVSVGYRTGDFTETKGAGNQMPTRKYKWTPMEGSSVPIPADYGVGIGRSAPGVPTTEGAAAPVTDAAPTITQQTTQDDTTTAPIRAQDLTPAPKAKEQAMSQDAAANGAATEDRFDAIEAIKLCKQHGYAEQADEILQGCTSMAEARGRVLDRVLARSKASVVEGATSAPIDISPKERVKGYSITRILRAYVNAQDGRAEPWKDAGYEREVSRALAKQFGRDPQGVYVATWLGTRTSGQLDSATASQGAELVFTEPGSFIELLRKRMFTIQAGARILSGLTAPIAFPRQTGAGTFSWTGEAAGSGVSLSNLTLDQVTLSAKTGQSATTISRNLTVMGVIGAEELIRQDIAKIHALALDLAGLNGSGSSNQPRGILNTTGIGSVAVGTNGGAPTYGVAVDLETAVAAADADAGALAYMTTPGIRGKLKKTETFASTNGMPVWTGGVDNGELNGYRAYASSQVPSNLTKGTSTTVCHAVLFGNWNELIYGEWGAMDMIVDPYTLADRGLIKLVSFQMMDVALRHPASFAACKDATTA